MANEEYLCRNAFVAITKEGKRFCLREEVDDILDHLKDTLICFFDDRGNSARYNGKITELTLNQASAISSSLVRKKVR